MTAFHAKTSFLTGQTGPDAAQQRRVVYKQKLCLHSQPLPGFPASQASVRGRSRGLRRKVVPSAQMHTRLPREAPGGAGWRTGIRR